MMMQFNTIDEDEIQGSKFAFFLFRGTNTLMMGLGILVIVASVYVYLLLQVFTIIDFCIIGIGCFIIAISYYSFRLKDSLVGLSMYIGLTLLYLFCQLIASMVIASSPENVVNYILTKVDVNSRDDMRSQIEAQVKIVQYIMIVMLVTTVQLVSQLLFIRLLMLQWHFGIGKL